MECTLCDVRRASGADMANIKKGHRVAGIIAGDKALLSTAEELNV